VLFDPGSHERPIDDSWDPQAVEVAIHKIVADAEGAFDGRWPTHPLDDDDPLRFRTVYSGAPASSRRSASCSGAG
jgi:hypothetical protein